MIYQVSKTVNWNSQLRDVPHIHHSVHKRQYQAFATEQVRTTVAQFVAQRAAVQVSNNTAGDATTITASFFFIDAERWLALKQEMIHEIPKGYKRSGMYHILELIEAKLIKAQTNG